MTSDLSLVGVSVLLPVPLPEGAKTVFRRPAFDNARPIYVQVVRCVQDGEVFRHGCVIVAPLSPSELTDWLR
jgi:hypothetical protein